MRKMTKRVLVIALTLLLALGAAAQAQTLYTLKAARLYKKNKASSQVLAALTAGEAVELVAAKGKWAKVEYKGKNGYIKKALLGDQDGEAQEEQEDNWRTLYAQAQLKLYKAQKTSAKVLCKIPQGAGVKVISLSGKWAKAEYEGKSGFVLKAKLGEDSAPGQSIAPGEETPQQAPYETLKPGDSGEAVKKLQKRLKALEWFYGDIGGNYKTLTTQAVKDFQEAVGLKATGVADSDTQRALYDSDAPKNVIDSNGTPASGRSKEMDWWTSGIQDIFARGKSATVTDVETGLTWQVIRSGGTNHADVQPKTARDTALMKKAYGGVWSWNRRAIWVSIGGNKYAASMNGMPHGSGSIKDNNFDGHHCIHFTNSRTHGSNAVCALHQAAIKKALAAG